GQVAEALHWMLASLRASPDADFRKLVRVHLGSWGGRVPTLRHWLDTPHRHAAFSPDGTRLVTAGRPGAAGDERPGTLQFWDLGDGRPLGEPLRPGDLGIGWLAFSPDGGTLLTVSGNEQELQYRPGWARLWDVASRRPRLTVPHAGDPGHTSTIVNAA